MGFEKFFSSSFPVEDHDRIDHTQSFFLQRTKTMPKIDEALDRKTRSQMYMNLEYRYRLTFFNRLNRK